MRTTFLLIIAIAFFCIGYAKADSLDLTNRGQQFHAAIGFGATLAASESLQKIGMPENQSILFSSSLVMMAALIHELSNPPFSSGDLKAAGIGVVSGCALSVALHF